MRLVDAPVLFFGKKMCGRIEEGMNGVEDESKTVKTRMAPEE